MALRAGIYLRISDDTQGLRAGVKRQEADCREICARKGWVVAGVYEDNDTSAFGGKRRAEYERLCSDIKAGVIGAVAVWHADRLHRRPGELEEFMKLADASGVELATATGDIDLSTGEGRFQARIMGAVAAKESDDKSRRLRRKHEELARDGKLAGGGFRPFGFEADRITVNTGEARLIRQAAKRLLVGESIRSILRDWQTDGVTTSQGGPWAPTAFKRMMLSPRIAGLREHRGEVVGPAIWKPIIDVDTHQRLRTRLLSQTSGRRQRERKYLLTGGLAVCGLCGAPLVSRPTGAGVPSMVCASGPGFTGCGRIRITAEPLEEFVGAAVIEALDSKALLKALLRQTTQTETHDAEASAEIETLQERLEALSNDYYVEARIGRTEYFRARDSLAERLEAAKTRLSRTGRSRVLHRLPQGRPSPAVAGRRKAQGIGHRA